MLLRPKYCSLEIDLALVNRFDASPSPFDECEVNDGLLALLLVYLLDADERALSKSFSIDMIDGPLVVALNDSLPPYLLSSTTTQSFLLFAVFRKLYSLEFWNY